MNKSSIHFNMHPMNLLQKYSKRAFLFIFLALIVLGVIGFEQYSIVNDKGYTFIECLLKSLRLFGFSSSDLIGTIPLTLEIVRFLCPITTLSGLFLGFKKSISESFEEIYRWITILRIRRFDDHIIICGLSKKSQLLIDDILKEDLQVSINKKVVLIESNVKHPDLPAYLLKGVHYILGSATEEAILIKSNVLKAKAIVALTDNDETNIEISKKLSGIYKSQFDNHPDVRNCQLKSIVHLQDNFLLQVFKDYHEIQTEKDQNHNALIDYHAINIYAKAAQKIVDTYSPDRFINTTNPDDPKVEIMIVGLSQAGENILIQAAHMYHFLNIQKLKVYLVDHEVGDKLKNLINFIPPIKNMLEIVCIELTDFLENPFSISMPSVSVCFVALEKDGESIFYSRKLKQIFYELYQSTLLPKLVVVLPEQTRILDLLDNIETESNHPLVNIDYLNLYAGTCTFNQIIEDEEEIDEIAKIIHFNYSKNKIANLTSDTLEQLWNELNDGLRDSNRFSARHLKYKLRFLHVAMMDPQQALKEGRELFHIKDVDSETISRITRMEHQRWMYEKLLNGYVSCPDIHDSDLQSELKNKLKLHKDFIGFDELDEFTKEKDIAAFMHAEEIAGTLHKVLVKI